MRTLRDDPIVAEIRSIRDRQAARFDYDIQAICEDIRARQETSGLKFVNYSAAGTDPDRVDEASQPTSRRRR